MKKKKKRVLKRKTSTKTAQTDTGKGSQVGLHSRELERWEQNTAAVAFVINLVTLGRRDTLA